MWERSSKRSTRFFKNLKNLDILATNQRSKRQKLGWTFVLCILWVNFFKTCEKIHIFSDKECFELWEKCEAPIYSALLVVFVSEQMQLQFNYLYEDDMADIFKKQKRSYSFRKSFFSIPHFYRIQATEM